MTARPVLVYDGDCGFCRLWIARWRAATGERVEYVASREAAARFPKMKRSDLDEAVHLVEPGGRVTRGAEAVFRSLAVAGGAGRLALRAYERVPPFRAASEAAYRLVAANRPLFSRATRLLWGPSPEPAPVEGTRRVLLAGIGLSYLAAFWSFGVQVRGLVGSNGLLPIAPMLAAASGRLGPERFFELPTLAWLFPSDGALVAMCAAGAVLSLGLVLDVAAGACALACWVLYLSLVCAGSDFMGYQWDALLLEAGLIAVLLAPWALRARRRTPASRGALLLMRLLLAKLMLESAGVKLLSGDPSWRNLTALIYHHWTQPLPTPLAWFLARLPPSAQKLSCAATLAVEFGSPLLLLGPRRIRALGAALVAALMVAVAASGNYGFFNLLTAALCVSALDDSFLPLALLARPAPRAPSPRRARLVGAYAAVWLAASALVGALPFGLRPPLARVWTPALSAVEPLRSINQYGLFAVMTTTRDEIMLEVSADGRDWREWPFKWKPGDPRRAPPLVAPHMPRLDWQMWFAALGAPSPWFNNLLARLLEGSPDVEALLGPSPLGGARPLYARASTWTTRFSTPAERRADGSWWRRERKGLYFPVVSLKPR